MSSPRRSVELDPAAATSHAADAASASQFLRFAGVWAARKELIS